MDCLIFDFDGVIVDSEPMHLEGFQQVLAEVGIPLSREDYYTKYLGYDDHDCFATVLRDRGRPVDEAIIRELTTRKTRLVQQALERSIQPLPGARELILSASAAKLPLAICSGALRDEIHIAARAVGVDHCFATIVAARDVSAGKPDPQGYLLAIQRLRDITGRPLSAARSIVIEDSPAGIEAGKRAGMAVLAVATSYPPAQLATADRVVDDLRAADLQLLESIVA